MNAIRFRPLVGLFSFVVLGLGLTGCSYPHVNIKLPPRGASLEKRSLAFQVYRRKGLGFRVYIERLCLRLRGPDGRRLEEPERYTTTELRCPSGRQLATRRVREAMPSILLLGSGAKIHHLSDLLPAVSSRSRTAYAIHKSQSYAKSAQLSFGIGVPVSLTVGMVLAGISFGLNTGDPENPSSVAAGFLISGVSVALLGLIGSSVAGGVLSAKGREWRWNAYDAYNRDLIDRLGLDPGTQGQRQ